MKNLDLFSPIITVRKTKTTSFWIKALLFFSIICGYGNRAPAQDTQVTQGTSYEGWGQDEYGIYIQFYVCDESNNLPITYSSAIVYVNDGSGAKPIFLYGWTGGRNVAVIPRQTGVRLRAFNGDDNNNTWSDFTPVGSSVTKVDGGSTLTEGHVRWYMPDNILFKNLTFTVVINYTTVLGGAKGSSALTYHWTDNNKTNHYSFYFNHPYTYNASFSFAPSKTPGKMTVNYSYNSTIGVHENYNYSIKHWMDNDTQDAVTDKTNSFPSGSLDVDMSNHETYHTLNAEFTGKGGYMSYIQTQYSLVPAYVWPSSFTATYDHKDSVKLDWKDNIYTLGTGFVDNDNFEIQRSTDPTFATNTVNVATYPYKSSQSHYTVYDNLSNLNGGTHIYYRIRRTKSSNDWNWKEAKTTDLSISMNTTQIADTAILSINKGTPEATITWQPFRGVWIKGTKFSLRKSNKTTGAVAATIELTEDQARSGQYIDKNITYCNEFTYSIVITLGNNFTSPPETLVPGSILAVDIGTITHLTASKGYFPDRTELKWHSQGDFDNYIVKRKIYGSSDNFIQIANIPGSSTSDLLTDDSKGAPGVYYQYMVLGAVKCNNELKYSKDTLYAIGFRAPTGNIYGRVTFQNGQAEENAAVRLQNDDNTQLGQSIYLNGAGNSYLKLDSLHTPFEDSAFTIEAWIRPDDANPANEVIFSRQGQYELGFDQNGKLYFSFNGTQATGNYVNKNNEYIHVTGIHTKDSLLLMLNDSIIAKTACIPSVSTPDNTLYIGRNKAGNNYKGYIDEMSIWNMALTPKWVAKNYTRLLTGGEPGLAAYWRFDETIDDQFYDLSHLNEKYNMNDGEMDPQYVKRSALIPDAAQLSLKAYTDSTGNYLIEGIPYSGQGTTYTIVPLFGTHQFDPTSVNRLVSAGSNSFSVNFTDNSSFPVTGTIYYFNSTVPVTGVRFKIDGKYAQQSNGDLIQTDPSGKFTISVPVGIHQVQAVMNNHIFVHEGLITDRRGNSLNYQKTEGPFTLYDSTTIRFIGRVAGGAVQEAYPLGFSLSKNNLGKQLSITLTLPVTGKYQLVDGNDSTIYVKHLTNHDSLSLTATDTAKTRVVYSKDQIIIHPDSLTGEFEADLIPVKFVATNVQATGWPQILDGKNVSLDFSNKFVTQYATYSYKDSTQADTTWHYQYYTDTVAYSDSYQFIKRVIPTVTITQLDNGGKDLPYFGDTTYVYHSITGTAQNIPVIDKIKTGRDQYLFYYPVFKQNKLYHFKIQSFEKYDFYESSNKVLRIDKVPTEDGVVSIYNNIREGSTQADTLSLDSAGIGYYDFTAGYPEIAAPGLKDFSAVVQFGKATNVKWKWLGNDKMEVFTMGEKLSGTDFVTAGPNKILMVLRDPPGNQSYSYAEQGSTISNSTTYTGTVDNVNDVATVAHLGPVIETWEGIGAGLIQKEKAVADLGVGVHLEAHYAHNDTKVSTVTLTSRFQTSSASTFVGAPADLYVGFSTNITYGQSNNIIIIKRNDLKSTDAIIFQSSLTSPYLVVSREGINFGEKFGTLFAFPQQHIVKILIPNLIQIRNTLLLPSTTNPDSAQLRADNTKQEVYISKLSSDNPNFGKSNFDTLAFGSKAKSDPFGDGESYKIYFPAGSTYQTDTIMSIDQYIHGWQQEIADNEKEKLNAKLMQNYSFHAGNPITYSEQDSYSHAQTNSFNIIVSGRVFGKIGLKVMGIGVTVKASSSLGTNQGGSFGNTNSSQSAFGFQLAASGTDEYLSVDVDKAEKEVELLPGITIPVFDGFVFRTKGGQSGCPYEGASVTKYYQPGTLVDQPTAQIEVPKIKVDDPVVNNVPSTQVASYTLYLSNESEAHLPATFVLSYANTDSVKGAFIAVDGSSIAGSGRAFAVQYGQTVKKVLTLRKGPKAMDYNNIPIILHSACQYDPTGYQALIADTVLISAHFVPSCSNINIKSPPDQWILNTLSQTNQQGKRYLPVTLNGFDESNNLFDHIELQYKPSATSQWITSMDFYGDSAKYKAAQGGKAFITNAQGINYDMEMDDASFNDQPYDIRALAVCQLGPGNYINTPSNVVSGIKDTYPPRLFGSPEPANGVLGIDDNIELKFNEPIAAGLLTPADFQVTGIRNGAKGDHSVSAELDGKSDYIQSEFSKNLANRNLTAEMWVLPDAKENGTVFSQGNLNESIELAFTSDNHLQVTVGKKIITSDKTLDQYGYQPGNWAHIALEYNVSDSTVSAFYNFQAVIDNAQVAGYQGSGPFVFGKSISKQGNYFSGKVHEARVWTQLIPATTLQINSLERLSGSEDGLLAYYPMNEGRGATIFDKAHGDNATLAGTWSTPPGEAMALQGNGYVSVPSGAEPVTGQMDYTLSLWFKAKPGQSDVALASNGKGDGSDPGTTGSKNLFYLGFENGLLSYENNGFKVQVNGNYEDDQWHHVAVAVNRTAGTGRFFVDDTLKSFFNTQNLGGLASANIYLGARGYRTDTNAVTPTFDRYFNGEIDEFRLWNSYLNQSLIEKNSNVRLKGDELGLMLYYPFEKYYEFQGQKEMDTSLMDQKIQEGPNKLISYAHILNASFTNDMAPIKDRGPVDNLNFSYVVNNDALIINMLEPKQAIDKTIITFRVKNVQDQHGNPLISPITWTAYIDQNPLNWSDDEMNLSKKLYAPLQFTSYIVNSGGSNENFTLDNLPAWLTADITSGTVPPEGKQKITFTVNEGLNVGTYNEIAYMTNDNDETQALPINIKVNGQTPDWKVNPADFQYNMTIYGKIRIDGIYSVNPDDILAVFVDGKCVGLTHNTYFAKQDLWYAFLTVYSDSIKQNDLEFRIWDASNGKIYEGIPSQPVSFVSDGVAGTPDVPIIFDGKELLFQNINLAKGWNWISFDLASNNLKSVKATLANGNWQSDDIVKHDERGFDQYSSFNGWVGTLTGFDNTSLFKLKTGNEQTLSVGGTLPVFKNTPITVHGGRWNYISYLPQVNMTLEEALADYKASSGDEIKSQTGFSMYSDTKGWVGNLTYLEPGKGYMLYRKASDNTQFTYPNISGSLTIHRLAGAANAIGRLNPYQSPVPGNYNYADNMTMIAVTGQEFHLLPGDKLLAYTDGELRGEAQTVTNPVTHQSAFFMNIAGKENQPLYFEIKRGSEVKAQSDLLFGFAANGEVGSLAKPYVIHFNQVIQEIKISPNPFSNEVNIRIGLGISQPQATHTIQLSVYNTLGQAVYSGSEEKITGGYYQTSWNGRYNDGLPARSGVYFIRISVDGRLHVYKVVKY